MRGFNICKKCGKFDFCPGLGAKKCNRCKDGDLIYLDDSMIDETVDYFGDPSQLGFSTRGNDFVYNYFGKDNLPPLFEETVKEDKKIYEYIKKQREWDEKQRRTYSKPKPTPKCPTCGSTNVSKIGFVERSVSVGFLGLFSNKINKSYKCKDCGCTW